MKILKTILPVLLPVVLLVTFLLPVPAAASDQNAESWTYLVYMAADNNLDTWGDYSLNLMKQGVTSDSNVNVIVLYDHYGANAELLRVTSAGVVKLQDYGEPDMADPAVLQGFLTWGIQNYPADHYAVSIWSHGGGWKFIIKDDTNGGDRMSIAQLGAAFNDVTLKLGGKFDVTIFDACLMSMVEVADQLTQSTDYVVASEQSVPVQSFPYDTMLRDIIAHPAASAGSYAAEIADDYYNSYVNTSGKSVLSVSAIDETKVASLVSSVDKLASVLAGGISDAELWNCVDDARAVAQHQVTGAQGIFWYVDLHQFAAQLVKESRDITIGNDAQDLIDNLTAAVYEKHSHNLEGKAYGLAVNFPPNLAKYQDKNYLAQNYQAVNLKFTGETHWDEMLLAFYQYGK